MAYRLNIDAPLGEAFSGPAETRVHLDEGRRGLEVDLGGARRGGLRLLALVSTRPRDDEPGGLVTWRRRRVEAFILDHLCVPLVRDDLALVAGLSVSHFGRQFKRSFGCSPREHIVRLRLDRARHLMLTTDAPLGEIALACGFSDQGRLSKLFRKAAGQTPRSWRRMHARPEEAAAFRTPARRADRSGAVLLTLRRGAQASTR
jgi:AraC family transcriptional regulator